MALRRCVARAGCLVRPEREASRSGRPKIRCRAELEHERVAKQLVLGAAMRRVVRVWAARECDGAEDRVCASHASEVVAVASCHLGHEWLPAAPPPPPSVFFKRRSHPPRAAPTLPAARALLQQGYPHRPQQTATAMPMLPSKAAQPRSSEKNAASRAGQTPCTRGAVGISLLKLESV